MQRWHGFPLGIALIAFAAVLAGRVTRGTGGEFARIGAAVFFILGAFAFFSAFSRHQG